MKLFVILVALLLTVGVAHSKMYKWVDANGAVHYGDQPPPPSVKKVEEKNLGKNIIDVSELPYSVQQAVKKFPVTLYAYDCGELCTNARNFLGKRGVPYTEKNPQQPAELEVFKKLTGGGMEIPLLVIGQKTIKGFQEGEWNSALDDAGYPRNLPPKNAPSPGSKSTK